MKKILIILILGLYSCGANEGDIVQSVTLVTQYTDKIRTQSGGVIIVKHNTYIVGDTIHFCK